MLSCMIYVQFVDFPPVPIQWMRIDIRSNGKRSSHYTRKHQRNGESCQLLSVKHLSPPDCIGRNNSIWSMHRKRRSTIIANTFSAWISRVPLFIYRLIKINPWSNLRPQWPKMEYCFVDIQPRNRPWIRQSETTNRLLVSVLSATSLLCLHMCHGRTWKNSQNVTIHQSSWPLRRDDIQIKDGYI